MRGISAWRVATRLNDTSIGIELENPWLAEIIRSEIFCPV